MSFHTLQKANSLSQKDKNKAVVLPRSVLKGGQGCLEEAEDLAADFSFNKR